ncbi:Fe-S cluster assembly protein HesB [Nocardioides sp. KIGAM211]|uniref:Fe-S cluster assembly protein HesB n=1 Tax=Nocardioides luti TaxID=2761101 RepID=A0A7X0RCG3_9ACTN|nr:Fe-S cluster assembly protein HesB [Nocardioides luti]MBB6625777.1 Fe-S cluster assembly protein HesB [Nocardioides luti]
MLTLTENASTIVKDITTQPGLEDTTGLRITTEQAAGEPTFEVTAAAAPEPGDQTVDQDGATVYLDQGAAVMLEDKVLDAAVDPEGRVEFALGLQA